MRPVPPASRSLEGVSAWVQQWATINPSGRAFTVVGGESVTWSQLEDRVRRVARHLLARGIRAGDRVGCLHANSPEYVVTLHAVARLGAVFVPVNHRYAPRELRFVVEHAGMSLLVVGEQFEALVGESEVAVPLMTRSDWAALEDAAEPAAPASGGSPSWDDLGFLCYTSGSTGLPRAVELTHANFYWMSVDPILTHGIRSGDRLLTPLPLCYTGGMNAVMSLVHAGGELIVMDEFHADRALSAIEEHGATLFHGVPVMAQRMAAAEGWERADLSSLRQARVGGAPVSLDLIETWLARGVAITQGYGLTESAGAGFQLHVRDCRRVGKAGRTSFHMEARVVDGRTLEDVETGVVGELLLRGPQIMRGYWQDPEATAATFHEGWLRTGDLVRRDDDGLFEVAGRSKELIITGGLNVYPPEVEAVIGTLPGVAEVAVLGLPSDEWGQIVVAVVWPEPGAEVTPAGVVRGARAALADYKCPKAVHLAREPLPRTASGKILKRTVLEELTSPAGSVGS